jgi:hypothetical protein
MAPHILNVGTEVSRRLQAPADLSQQKSPSTQRIGGWAGPRAGLGAVAKIKNPFTAPAGNRTSVVQPFTWSLYWLNYTGYKRRFVIETLYGKIIKCNKLENPQNPKFDQIQLEFEDKDHI